MQVLAKSYTLILVIAHIWLYFPVVIARFPCIRFGFLRVLVVPQAPKLLSVDLRSPFPRIKAKNSFLYLCPATYSLLTLYTDIGRLLPKGVPGSPFPDHQLEITICKIADKWVVMSILSEMCYCWSRGDISVLYVF